SGAWRSGCPPRHPPPPAMAREPSWGAGPKETRARTPSFRDRIREAGAARSSTRIGDRNELTSSGKRGAVQRGGGWRLFGPPARHRPVRPGTVRPTDKRVWISGFD